MAGDRSVHGEPASAGLPASNDEFVRQVLGGAEVHFIGGLAGERRMRHLRVVLVLHAAIRWGQLEAVDDDEQLVAGEEGEDVTLGGHRCRRLRRLAIAVQGCITFA